MAKITENTTLSIGLVIVLVGGVFWFSSIYFKTDANAAAVTELVKFVKSVDKRLKRIEVKMGLEPLADEE